MYGTKEIIDSRDLIERAAELRDQIEAGEPLDEEEAEELAAITQLEEEGSIADWQYGAALIHEDHFTQYAQDLAEDIGAINRDAAWPLSYIDWDAAAEALQTDYTTVEYLGETYYVR